MTTDCITQVTFGGEGFAKPVVARFDRPEASTDGGLVLLKALDTQLGLTARLAACLEDAREPGKVLHETVELLQQRLFGLWAGYADCNDAARLVHDPIHKLLVGRDPLTGLGLASQPTLSRFENGVSARELRAMMHVLADNVIAQQRRRLHGRATRITIDLDPTDDPTHGQQEFAFFNGHYDTWCYLPVVATVTFNDEPAQFAVAAVLRPGTAPAGLGARGILRAMLRKLRTAFPAATFRVRLDRGFASPKRFRFLEREQVEYVVAMASNRRLEKRAQRLMGWARVRSRQTGETAHLYGETRYAAQKWSRKRRVIIKAEVVRHPGRAPKDNPRFAVTSRALGAADRPAPAADVPVAAHVAAARPCCRRHVVARAVHSTRRPTQTDVPLLVPFQHQVPSVQRAKRRSHRIVARTSSSGPSTWRCGGAGAGRAHVGARSCHLCRKIVNAD